MLALETIKQLCHEVLFWYCFGFDVNYLHGEGYYPMRRARVTIMSTCCTKVEQARKNMLFKNPKESRQQDQK